MPDALLATERHHATRWQANQMAVVRYLCAHGQAPAVEIAMALGLAMPAANALLRRLQADGLVTERSLAAFSASSSRPLPRFELQRERLAFLGADVGPQGIRVVASSFGGTALESAVFPSRRTGSVAACVGALATALLTLCREPGLADRRVVAVGVALPSSVDEAPGDLTIAPALGWDSVPFGALLAQELEGTPLAGTPAFLRSDADAGALAEAEPESIADAASRGPLLYVNLSGTIRAGVVADGQLLAGHRGSPGEVGHVVLQADGPLCKCGRRGCADALIGSDRLLGALGEASAGRRRGVAAQALAAELAAAGGHLALLLQNLAVVYRPSHIVLGGPLVEFGDAFLNPALRAFAHDATRQRGRPAALSLSRFGANAVAVGGTALARYRVGGVIQSAVADVPLRATTRHRESPFFYQVI